MIPGERLTEPGELELNAGRGRVTLRVDNLGDRPVQVGSHTHFFKVNAELSFDRAESCGFRLDIPAGTALRFEPGEGKEVTLVAFGGQRRVFGMNGTGALKARLRKKVFTVTRERRPFRGRPPGEHSHGGESPSFEARMDAVLPPQYRERAANPAPMGSAGLQYDDAGRVAWGQMWGSFCDLALAGGPTHRGTLLEPPTPDEVRGEPEAYAEVVAALERAVPLVTGLDTVKSANPGWVGVRCRDEAMAVWLLRAVIVENVMVQR